MWITSRPIIQIDLRYKAFRCTQVCTFLTVSKLIEFAFLRHLLIRFINDRFRYTPTIREYPIAQLIIPDVYTKQRAL